METRTENVRAEQSVPLDLRRFVALVTELDAMADAAAVSGEDRNKTVRALLDGKEQEIYLGMNGGWQDVVDAISELCSQTEYALGHAGYRAEYDRHLAELALKMEPLIEKRAKENQRAGGQDAEVGRQNSAQPLKTRNELAKAAGVSHETIRPFVRFDDPDAAPVEVGGLILDDGGDYPAVVTEIRESCILARKIDGAEDFISRNMAWVPRAGTFAASIRMRLPDAPSPAAVAPSLLVRPANEGSVVDLLNLHERLERVIWDVSYLQDTEEPLVSIQGKAFDGLDQVVIRRVSEKLHEAMDMLAGLYGQVIRTRLASECHGAAVVELFPPTAGVK